MDRFESTSRFAEAPELRSRSTFAFVALMLTAAGLYGRDGVRCGAEDAGNRRAHGARRDPRSECLALMLRQAGAMTAVGIGLGVVGAGS